MATVTHHQMKQGLKVILDNDPCTIVGADFIKPGKGQAFTRIKLRNLLTGRILEKTYKSSDSLELADVVDTSMQYLYTDGEMWHFMNPESYEQIGANAAAMGGAEQWLKEEDVCQVTLWNGQPIAVEAPNFVYLKVSQTDPGLRGDVAGIRHPAVAVPCHPVRRLATAAGDQQRQAGAGRFRQHVDAP